MRQQIIDIEKLLAPISPDKPAGNYLRYEREYDNIIDAMKGEDPNLTQGVWVRPLKKYDWQKAKELCTDALSKKTKDIQLACWLTESLMYIHGFCGLADGLKLLCELSKKYWNEIHPLPAGTDMELRFAPYEWLDEKFYIRIKLIPIVKAQVIVEGYTYYTWEHEVKKIHENHEDESKALETYLSILVSSTEEFHLELDKCIDESLQIIKEIKEFLAGKSSSEPLAFSRLIQTLKNIKDINEQAIKYFASRKKSTMPKEAVEKTAKSTEEIILDTGVKHDFKIAGLTSVDYAYESLEQLSDFLIQNEPEYLTGYMVKQAISFRYMDLKEFLNRRISNKKNLSKVLEILKLS